MGDEQNTPDRSSRLTLTWGGAGIAFASLFPLLSNAGFVFPALDLSWVYANHPVVSGLSMIALVAGFVVLAVGLRGETGIAGSSVVGRVALIVYAVAHTTSTGYFGWPAPGPGTDPVLLAIDAALTWGLTLLSLIALVVAAVVVFRADVVRGVAAWALPALAATTVIALLASTIPSLAFIPVWIGALIVSELLQLATGVVYIVEGQRARTRDGLRVASA